MKRRSKAPYLGDVAHGHRYCGVRLPKPAKAAQAVTGNRLRLIRETAYKWMNGTTIKYWFFDAPSKLAGPDAQKDVVRKAFKMWKARGIGIDFAEAASKNEADLRIAFNQAPDEGSWSYVGTDCASYPLNEPTMNFGWSLTNPAAEGLDTALHEIGHAIGFPHEHQNPFAGIVWNEPAVYKSLAGDPNYWSKSKTFHNIIEKIVPDTVQGSSWDPNSIMHYPFDAGLIKQPAKYQNGLTPKGGISKRDKSWARKFYPPLKPSQIRTLNSFQSTPLKINPGKQADFNFKAGESREYSFSTFGTADTQLALLKAAGAKLAPLAQDDDSGADRNANVRVKLKKGDVVRVQVRMRYIDTVGEAALMVW